MQDRAGHTIDDTMAIDNILGDEMKVTYLIKLDLGETLFLLRKRRHMTMRDVEEITGVSIATLSRIERNQSEPTIETLSKLAECYGCHLEIDLKAKDES